METKNLSIAERVNELYKFAIVHNLATDKQTFSQLIGISASTLSRFLSGKKEPSKQTLLKINESCGGAFNPEWLVSGNGEMMIAGRDNYGTHTGHIREDAVVQTGNNNQTGIPPKKFESEKEWFALVAEKDKQIDRLLTIIETITNNSK